ncbi:SixA phosphatase family protein [Kineococcus sp. NUM-3379]
MPTLVVVRHAKAASPAGLPDFDRPLSPRGRRDAVAAAQWLRENVPAPGLVVTSPARRAEETTNALLTAWDPAPPVVTEERVYEASLGDLLLVVRGLDEPGAVVLVGHNPGLSVLVEDLATEVLELATTGIAVVEVPGDWADAGPHGCTVTRVHTARAPHDPDELF